MGARLAAAVAPTAEVFIMLFLYLQWTKEKNMDKYRITLQEHNGDKKICVELTANNLMEAIKEAQGDNPGYEAIGGYAYVENVSTRENPDFYVTDWDELCYIISGALYGSSWASADYEKEDKEKYRKPEHECYEDILTDILFGGGKILITDEEEAAEAESEEEVKAAEHWLGLDDFRRALVTFKEGFSNMWSDLVDDHADYFTYDAILQLACFKELVYG